jgi:hypothetical protein
MIRRLIPILILFVAASANAQDNSRSPMTSAARATESSVHSIR